MTDSINDVLYRVFRQTFSFTLDYLYTLLILGLFLGFVWYFYPERVKRAGSWVVLILLVWVQMRVLGTVSKETVRRLEMQRHSPYTTVSAAAGGDTVQYAPSAAFEEITTRSQKLTFSDERFEAVGLTALPGWNGYDSYYSDAVIAVEDKLERTPHATFVKRDLTYSYFHPIDFDDSLVALKLDFVPDSTAYHSTFEATYRFRNPRIEKTKVRFTFPLPAQSGTLTDFQMSVNGEESDTQWEGEVEAGQEVEVKVCYRNYGRRSWTYSPTQQRASVRNLRLDLISDNSQIKFRRDSLFPTTEGSGKWSWSLKDVITSQDICVVFPSASKVESVAKLFTFGPLALLTFALMPALLGFATPGRAALSSVAYGSGLTLASYLCTEHSLFLSTALGCGVGVGLGLWILGRRCWPLALLFWLVPLTFSWPGCTGLALTAGGMVALPLVARTLG